MEKLPGSFIRELKGRAQRLDPVLHFGKAGLSYAFIRSVDDALAAHALIKIRFVEGKADRKALAAAIAEKTASHLVTVVGHVAVFYRPLPDSR
jgi:RNA-binding protein